MSEKTPSAFVPIAFVAMLLWSGVGVAAPAETARAADCLSAPNSAAPQGSHWYYRLDRATKRKCWYVRALGQPAGAGRRHGALANKMLTKAEPCLSSLVESRPLTGHPGRQRCLKSRRQVLIRNWSRWATSCREHLKQTSVRRVGRLHAALVSESAAPHRAATSLNRRKVSMCSSRLAMRYIG